MLHDNSRRNTVVLREDSENASATNIALGLSGILRQANAHNHRVLLIDTDSQAHATLVTTGRKDFGTDDSLYSVLMADPEVASQILAQVITPSTWNDDLHVLPASHLLEGAERELGYTRIRGGKKVRIPYTE